MPNVFILQRISGSRDGADWPAVGGSLVVPDEEAQSLIRMGFARLADVASLPAPVERAVAPKATTRKKP